ncbi:MAG: RNA polymerase factor sigma-54 [Acidobacteria bacterium]|nr:RNA polymerase factor sigma-54 [Acidobacteriota bacterium]
MALEQKLQLRLAQKLVMTPSLQQAIKLLQMTRMEVQTTITQELVENPVLEEGDFEESATDDDSDAEAESPEAEAAKADPMENIDFEAYFSEYLDGGPGLASGSRLQYREAPPLEATLSREPDLYDHLLWQLRMAELPDRQREIGELIVGNLNPEGFLVATAEEIRAMGDGIPGEARYSPEEVDSALAFVRGFDPPGIACWTLSECLLRQLDARGEPEDSLVRQVVGEHWDLFLKRQFPALAKKVGAELAELEPVLESIKSLETRPGRRFNNDQARYVEPDVYVIKLRGEYVIQVNEDGLPKLRISGAYRKMLREVKSDSGQTEAKNFIREKLRSALWLIKSIDQRQRTIYKVAHSIVRQQRDFLDNGIDRLRPMVLRDVADDIGMHESTVSRVVSNKYMHTPRGVFPMKFFFHSGIERDYGGDISSLTVKRKIRQLIETENQKRPLSDSELTRILKREGINIARRTVAKYRDELGIGSSTQRKEIF